MRSVEDKLQKPMLQYIDDNKARWGIDYLVRPDGPPFITLNVRDKLKELGIKSKGFRELTLRLGVPVLVNDGVVRILFYSSLPFLVCDVSLSLSLSLIHLLLPVCILWYHMARV